MTKVLCGFGRLLEVGLKRKRYPPTGLEHRVPLHENQVVFYLHFSHIQKCAKFTLEEKRVLVWSQKVDDRRVTVAKFRRMVKGCALLQNILAPFIYKAEDTFRDTHSRVIAVSVDMREIAVALSWRKQDLQGGQGDMGNMLTRLQGEKGDKA